MSGIVTVPEGKLNDVEVRRFEIEKKDRLRSAFAYGARAPEPGTYTGLFRSNGLWMSDTPAEQRDHIWAMHRARELGGRVIVNGLGLGMFLEMILRDDPRTGEPSKVTHVDVVEIDPDVIALVGPHYTPTGKVTIHEADAHEITWPRGTQWSFAWHDIWQHITTDDIPSRSRLNRMYGRRVTEQQAWASYEVKDMQRRDRAWEAMYG